MSKEILIVDTEECCADCPCSWIDNKGIVICLALRGEEVGKDGIKPDWCPLKPIKPNLLKALRCLGSKDQYNYCYKTQYNRDRGDKPEMSCNGTIKSIPCPYHQDEYDTDFGSDGCQKLLNELADMLERKEK